MIWGEQAWVVVFLEDYGVAFQSIVAVAVLQISLLLHTVHHPHTTELTHRIEMASLCVTAVTTLAAALHAHLKDTEALVDCTNSPIENSYCGEGSTGRADAALAAAVVLLLDLAMCGVMGALVWHKSFDLLVQKYQKIGKQHEHTNVVGKIRAQSFKDKHKNEATETAEKLRKKALTVEAAAKACHQLNDRVRNMKVEMPELAAEFEMVKGSVDRLGALIVASKERTKSVQANFTRGELKQKLRRLALGAGVVNDSHWTALFARYDKDGSGELDDEEFRRAIRLDAKVSRATMSDEEINQIFDWVDIDAGGSVSAAEFEEFLREDDDNDEDLEAEAEEMASAALALEEGKKIPIKLKKSQKGLAAAKYMVAAGGFSKGGLSSKFGHGTDRELVGAKQETEQLSIDDTVAKKATQINLVTSFSKTAWGDERSPSDRTRSGGAGSSPVKLGQFGSTPTFLNRAQAKVELPGALAQIAAQSTIQVSNVPSTPARPALKLKRPGQAPQLSPPKTGDPARRAGVGV